MIVQVCSIDSEMAQTFNYEEEVINDRSDEVTTQKYYAQWSQKVRSVVAKLDQLEFHFKVYLFVYLLHSYVKHTK